MKRPHVVRVLGRELSVKSSASIEKVRSVEAFINERLEEIGSVLKNADAQLVLTLALLNITEELLDLRSALEQNRSLDDRLRGIIEKLEKA